MLLSWSDKAESPEPNPKAGALHENAVTQNLRVIIKHN